MNRKLAALLVVATLGLLAQPALAVFENITLSPRARAMGDAGTAVIDAPYATYLNPAGLALMPGKAAAGLSYEQPYNLDFNKLYFLGGAFALPGKAGALGLGLRQYGVDYEDVDLQKETTITLSHGITLFEDIHSSVSFGYGLNLYRLEFAETVSGFEPGDATAFGLDLALMAVVHERTRIGVFIHNVNSPKIGRDEEEIPQRIHGAVAYEPYSGVITTFELENTTGDKVQWRGGMEFEVVTGFDLRAGIMSEPSKITAGFGYKFRGYALNYGYSTGGGVLESSHQFGLTGSWGGEAK